MASPIVYAEALISGGEIAGVVVTLLEPACTIQRTEAHSPPEICKRWKIQLKKNWKNNFWLGDGENFTYIPTEQHKTLIPFCLPKMKEKSLIEAVVLHGPPGLGKTTLAKKLMLDWSEGNLSYVFKLAFYLNCRQLNHMGPCTFQELIAGKCENCQTTVKAFLEEGEESLFVVDGLDELRIPPGALIRDICRDVTTKKPVPILLSSLLKGKMALRATIVVTTSSQALREILFLVDQAQLVKAEGFLENHRQEYFLRHFGNKERALQALNAMRSNATLFHMGAAPAVCWIVCTYLELLMDREDPVLACQTCTAPFLKFLCSRFRPASDGEHLRVPLESLCLLAAQGLWKQLSIFYKDDIHKLGLKESDLKPFLDTRILQKDNNCRGYFFVHISIQQLLAAMFYLLQRQEEEEVGQRPKGHVESMHKLFSKEARLKNPNLAQAGLFLFGLLNEKRARELETTFGCRTSMEVKQELLQCGSKENDSVFSLMDLQEVFSCLYESQDEDLVHEAMAPYEEIALHLKTIRDITQASFCLKNCHSPQRLSLQVAQGIFLDHTASGSEPQENSSQSDQCPPPSWTELCSVLGSNKSLTILNINQSFLSNSSLQILCEKLASTPCHFQNVILKNISPTDAYQKLCLAFSGCETLTHLTLEDGTQENTLPSLCEVLRHPKCNLQCLRLGSCNATVEQWSDFFLALKVNQTLIGLDLSNNKLCDIDVEMLCVTLKQPKCFLQKVALENCNLTESCCKDLSSALVVSQTLTHLSLAKNHLGNSGVKILCEGLCYPDCKLQTLVLRSCNITSDGCGHLSKLLQQVSRLVHLDLGMNDIGITGVTFLCEALMDPVCNLQSLWLCGCSITPMSCRKLSAALSSNQQLTTLDLGQNSLGCDGVKILCEALKQKTCSLQSLRLNTDVHPDIYKLLEEIKRCNPLLTIDSDRYDPKKQIPSSLDFFSEL